MEERRQYQRVYLDEYDYEYPCYIQYGDAQYSVKLLDISQGGARFGMEYGQLPSYCQRQCKNDPPRQLKIDPPWKN
jgi:c-di-GMP-binding flagellar brake protein YcgR